jgi:DNA-binding SARP family transcriptional activator
MRAREWFSQMVEGEAARVPFPQQSLANCNLARADLETGDFDACERRLEKAMELCRLFNLTLERAEAHELIGNLHRERGQLTRAREHYLQAEDLYRDGGFQLESRELPDEQLRLLIAEGNLSKARDAAEKLLEKRMSLGYSVPVARSRMLLARAELESATQGNPQASASGRVCELLTAALDQFTACRSNRWMARARFLLARAESMAGREEAAAAHLAEALRLSREFNYKHLVKVESDRAPELFHLAFARDIERDYLKIAGVEDKGREPGAEGKAEEGKRREQGGAKEMAASATVSSPLPSADEQECDLTIKMLGAVEILREQDRTLAPDAWTLSRALRILCFIASRQNRRATKDTIIETFWPDTPLEDIDKNFWPTISYIRRALNSNQEVKKNFIRYRESAYYLNPEFNYLLDTEEFQRLIARAHARRREGDGPGFSEAARRAIEIYRGEFLEEFYDNWVEEPRAYYRNIYFATLKELADYHHRAEDYGQSIIYCKMILNRDPYREDVHRQLMDDYARIGNRAALKEQYETLKTLLMEELGVDPLPETVATYKRLIG